MIAVESKESGRVEFNYDAFGRRIAKEAKDGKVGFLWDGDVLLAEERGAKSNEYIFEPGSFAPLCRFGEGSFEAYHNDHLGTPRELTDQRGQIVWSARYDVYGRIDQLQADRTENQIRFQGQYEDVETGLFYNFYRYYDSELGRYLSKDPLGFVGGVNQYAYTPNPVNWIDPLGLVATWNCEKTRGKGVRWRDAKGRFAKLPMKPDLLLTKETITPAELAEIQAIANKYNTTIEIVGSRAKNRGRNVFTDFPAGKNEPGKPPTRSDIDFRADKTHPQAAELFEELRKVGNGAGTAGEKWSTSDRSPYPPYIRVTPD